MSSEPWKNETHQRLNESFSESSLMKLPLPLGCWPVCIHAVPLCVAASASSVRGTVDRVSRRWGDGDMHVSLYLIQRECWGKRIVLTPLTCFLFWFGLVLGPTSVYVALPIPRRPGARLFDLARALAGGGYRLRADSAGELAVFTLAWSSACLSKQKEFQGPRRGFLR